MEEARGGDAVPVFEENGNGYTDESVVGVISPVIARTLTQTSHGHYVASRGRIDCLIQIGILIPFKDKS